VLGGTSQRAADAELARALARLVSMTGGPPGAIAVVQRGDTVHGYDVPALGPPEDLSEVMAAGWAWASGGMVSTPTELNRFIRGYVGGKFFDTATQNAQRVVIPGGSSEPPGPGVNAAGLGIFRYTTRCGTVFGHTGNFFGYTDFMAASPDGTRSVVVTASEQLRPVLNDKVFAALRRAEVLAVCAALAGR
jgi:D-alanyl-D-alanine carboxypeptidase